VDFSHAYPALKDAQMIPASVLCLAFPISFAVTFFGAVAQQEELVFQQLPG